MPYQNYRKHEFVRLYYMGNGYKTVQRMYQEIYGGLYPPLSTIRNTIQKFQNDPDLIDRRKFNTRPPNIEDHFTVCQAVVADKTISTRGIEREYGIPHTSAQCILQKNG